MPRSLVYKWKFPTTVWSDFVTMPKHLILIFHVVLCYCCCSVVAAATPAQQQRAVIEDDIIDIITRRVQATQYASSFWSSNLETWLRHYEQIDIVPSHVM